jgi:hypothetical protein
MSKIELIAVGTEMTGRAFFFFDTCFSTAAVPN